MSSDELRRFYTEAYRREGDEHALELGRWRALGARSKADHVEVLLARAGLRPASIVELGCGDGALLDELRDRALARERLSGAELSPTAAELARARGHDVAVFDGERVDAAGGAYDLAVLSHVVEHVPDPVPLLREAGRVARHVLVEVPLEDNRSGRRPRHRAESARIGHVHRLSRASLLALLDRAGLRVLDALADPLGRDHHAFFAGDPRRATVKWAVRAAAHRAAPRIAERLFTVHLAVLAAADQGSSGAGTG